jgi:hypothetical protein
VEVLHTPGNLFKLVQQGLEPLGAKAQFLNKPNCPRTALAQPPPRGSFLVFRSAASHDHLKIPAILLHKALEGSQVRAQDPHHATLFAHVRYGHFHGPIKTKATVLDPLGKSHGGLEDKVAGQHGMPEPPPGLFNPFGRLNFPFAGQQGNFSHLHQIDADRVVQLLFAILHFPGALKLFQQVVIQQEKVVVKLFGEGPSASLPGFGLCQLAVRISSGFWYG